MCKATATYSLLFSQYYNLVRPTVKSHIRPVVVQAQIGLCILKAQRFQKLAKLNVQCCHMYLFLAESRDNNSLKIEARSQSTHAILNTSNMYPKTIADLKTLLRSLSFQDALTAITA